MAIQTSLLQKELPPPPGCEKRGTQKLRRAMTAPTNLRTSSKGGVTSVSVTAQGRPSPDLQTKPLPAMPSADVERDLASAEASPTTLDFQGDVKVSNNPPSKATLATAGELPVLGVDGKKLSFKSLYAAADGEYRRVLIIFIRHFFCGARSLQHPCGSTANDGCRTVKNTYGHCALP